MKRQFPELGAPVSSVGGRMSPQGSPEVMRNMVMRLRSKTAKYSG